MKINICGLIMLLSILGIFSCESEKSDHSGTYVVCKNSNFGYCGFDLILNSDRSARVKMQADGTVRVAYGSWEEWHDGTVHITMDSEFYSVFRFRYPHLDPKTNRLYFDFDCYEQKHPKNYFNVYKN